MNEKNELALTLSIAAFFLSIIWALAIYGAPHSTLAAETTKARLAAINECVKLTQKPAECSLAMK